MYARLKLLLNKLLSQLVIGKKFRVGSPSEVFFLIWNKKINMEFFNKQLQISIMDWIAAILLSSLFTQKFGSNLEKGLYSLKWCK